MRLMLALTIALLPIGALHAAPSVFWVSDDVRPGDVVMAYGGGLESVSVDVSRLADTAAGTPPPAGSLPAYTVTSYGGQKPLQSAPQCVKFQVPTTLRPGVYATALMAGRGRLWPLYLNRPSVRFLQPTRLAPGLAANEAYPGATVQVIGTCFLSPTGQGKTQVAIRRANADWTVLPVKSVEKYSLFFDLPALAPGDFQLCVHNGGGGPAGWSDPLRFTVRQPEEWPARVYDVRSFGARGDDVHDDTPAVQAALDAAHKSGGGIVHFPYGTYRINTWIFLPPRTVLRGDDRETTWLKWPQNVPKDPHDTIKAAVFAAGSWGMENLSLMIRNADICVRDLSYDSLLGRLYRFPAPLKELESRMVPWGQERDVFLRRVRIQHLYLCGRPGVEFFKRFNEQNLLTFAIGGVKNCEVSDCIFNGTQRFLNLDNGRLTGNSFSNQMGGASWTDLAGRYFTFQNNDIVGASSWRWHGIPLEYLYSAHNKSANFERGERECMTFDINGLPGPLKESYWGPAVEVGNEEGKVFLRFAPPGEISPDGCVTGFVPHSYKGGTAIIHGYGGGPGAGQARTIVDNTEDTVFLDKPWNPPPDTERRGGYLEVQQPRGEAWVGQVARAEGTRLVLRGADLIPQAYRGLQVLVLEGPGAGQYREVLDNDHSDLVLDRPWDPAPDGSSTVAVYMLMRHALVYDCDGSDTSAFSQLWGNFYDLIVDGCRARRDQGFWGLSGWFVQLRDTRFFQAMAFHPGIGPGGTNPEGCTPYAPVGFTTEGHIWRLSPPVTCVRGAMLRNNWLSFNHRLVLQSGYNTKEQKDLGRPVFADVVIDGNTVDHSPVGIQIDPNVQGVVVAGNRFVDVAQPYAFTDPDKVLLVESQH